MLKLNYFLMVFLVGIAATAGCASKSDGEAVLAKFKGGTITRAEFEDAVENLSQRTRIMVQGQKKEFLDSLISEKLMLREAENRGLQHLDDVQGMVQQARERILIAKLLDEDVNSKAKTSQEDRARYFEEHAEDFMTPYRLRASHILLRTREDAEAVLVRLGRGEDFAELARELSLDPTGPKGGDIGYFQKGQLLAEIEEAAFGLELNELSGIVQTSFGYHVMKLTDVSQPRPQNFEVVEGDIEDKLLAEQKSEYFTGLLDHLRSKASIWMDEELLSQLDATGDKDEPRS